MARLQALCEAIETPDGGTLVYAGLVALTMVSSDQLTNEWNFVAMAQ